MKKNISFIRKIELKETNSYFKTENLMCLKLEINFISDIQHKKIDNYGMAIQGNAIPRN